MKTSKQLSILITTAVLAIFVIYFFTNSPKFQPLLDVNMFLLLIIAAGNILGVFINGLFTKAVLRLFNKHIHILESFYVSLISSVGNFFAPVGAGFGFRAIYLKRKHGLAYKDYISILSGNYIIVFLVNSFFGLSALYLLRDRNDGQYGILVAIFGAIFVMSLALSFIKLSTRIAEKQKNRYIKPLVNNLAKVIQGWNYIVSHRKLMLQLIALTTLNFILTAGITFTIVRSLHFSIDLGPLMLFSALGSLSLFINITPANLGIKEAVYLFSSGVLGFSTAQILSIALIDRGVMFLALAGLWVVSHKLKASFPEASAK